MIFTVYALLQGTVCTLELTGRKGGVSAKDAAGNRYTRMSRGSPEWSKAWRSIVWSEVPPTEEAIAKAKKVRRNIELCEALGIHYAGLLLEVPTRQYTSIKAYKASLQHDIKLIEDWEKEEHNT